MLSGVAVVAVLAAVPGVLAVAAVQALACFVEKCFFREDVFFSFFTNVWTQLGALTCEDNSTVTMFAYVFLALSCISFVELSFVQNLFLGVGLSLVQNLFLEDGPFRN